MTKNKNTENSKKKPSDKLGLAAGYLSPGGGLHVSLSHGFRPQIYLPPPNIYRVNLKHIYLSCLDATCCSFNILTDI